MISKILSLSASTTLALFACVSLAAADPAPPAKGDAKKPAALAATPGKPGAQQQVAQKADDTAKGLGAFGTILPLGQKNLDVKMPAFRDGKPSSLIQADSMTRTDENHMDMEKVDIKMFGLTQANDLRVQLITGAYNMDTQVLDSHQRSRVSRSDFQLEGDTMVFDTRTQQGKMVGHVHMIIYDASALTKKPGAAQPASAPSPAAAEKASAPQPSDGVTPPKFPK